MYVLGSILIGAFVSAAFIWALSRDAEKSAQFFIERDGAPRSANGKAYHAWTDKGMKFDVIACVTIVNASNIYASGGKSLVAVVIMTLVQIAILMIGMSISVRRFQRRHQPLVNERYMCSAW